MAGIHKSYEDRAISQAVAQLARSLNMDTVAEGVETDDQLPYAREAGFTNVQGYLLRRPMTDDKVSKLMAEHHSGDHLQSPAHQPEAPRISAGEHESATQRRSDERREGKACVSPCRSRWSQVHYTTNNTRSNNNLT